LEKQLNMDLPADVLNINVTPKGYSINVKKDKLNYYIQKKLQQEIEKQKKELFNELKEKLKKEYNIDITKDDVVYNINNNEISIALSDKGKEKLFKALDDKYTSKILKEFATLYYGSENILKFKSNKEILGLMKEFSNDSSLTLENLVKIDKEGNIKINPAAEFAFEWVSKDKFASKIEETLKKQNLPVPDRSTLLFKMIKKEGNKLIFDNKAYKEWYLKHRLNDLEKQVESILGIDIDPNKAFTINTYEGKIDLNKDYFMDLYKQLSHTPINITLPKIPSPEEIVNKIKQHAWISDAYISGNRIYVYEKDGDVKEYEIEYVEGIPVVADYTSPWLAVEYYEDLIKKTGDLSYLFEYKEAFYWAKNLKVKVDDDGDHYFSWRGKDPWDDVDKWDVIREYNEIGDKSVAWAEQLAKASTLQDLDKLAKNIKNAIINDALMRAIYQGILDYRWQDNINLLEQLDSLIPDNTNKSLTIANLAGIKVNIDLNRINQIRKKLIENFIQDAESAYRTANNKYAKQLQDRIHDLLNKAAKTSNFADYISLINKAKKLNEKLKQLNPDLAYTPTDIKIITNASLIDKLQKLNSQDLSIEDKLQTINEIKELPAYQFNSNLQKQILKLEDSLKTEIQKINTPSTIDYSKQIDTTILDKLKEEKIPIESKDIWITQGFNPKTGKLEVNVYNYNKNLVDNITKSLDPNKILEDFDTKIQRLILFAIYNNTTTKTTTSLNIKSLKEKLLKDIKDIKENNLLLTDTTTTQIKPIELDTTGFTKTQMETYLGSDLLNLGTWINDKLEKLNNFINKGCDFTIDFIYDNNLQKAVPVFNNPLLLVDEITGNNYYSKTFAKTVTKTLVKGIEGLVESPALALSGFSIGVGLTLNNAEKSKNLKDFVKKEVTLGKKALSSIKEEIIKDPTNIGFIVGNSVGMSKIAAAGKIGKILDKIDTTGDYLTGIGVLRPLPSITSKTLDLTKSSIKFTKNLVKILVKKPKVDLTPKIDFDINIKVKNIIPTTFKEGSLKADVITNTKVKISDVSLKRTRFSPIDKLIDIAEQRLKDMFKDTEFNIKSKWELETKSKLNIKGKKYKLKQEISLSKDNFKFGKVTEETGIIKINKIKPVKGNIEVTTYKYELFPDKKNFIFIGKDIGNNLLNINKKVMEGVKVENKIKDNFIDLFKTFEENKFTYNYNKGLFDFKQKGIDKVKVREYEGYLTKLENGKKILVERTNLYKGKGYAQWVEEEIKVDNILKPKKKIVKSDYLKGSKNLISKQINDKLNYLNKLFSLENKGKENAQLQSTKIDVKELETKLNLLNQPSKVEIEKMLNEKMKKVTTKIKKETPELKNVKQRRIINVVDTKSSIKKTFNKQIKVKRKPSTIDITKAFSLPNIKNVKLSTKTPSILLNVSDKKLSTKLPSTNKTKGNIETDYLNRQLEIPSQKNELNINQLQIPTFKTTQKLIQPSKQTQTLKEKLITNILQLQIPKTSTTETT
ncbi:MAG: hypothetical protein ABGW69_00140, partial [Nanoarchaeota archaeon]